MANQSFAVVTGASSGIGFELAKIFAEEGFDLLITAHDQPRLKAASEWLHKSGTEFKAVATDLSTYEGVEALYAAIGKLARPVDAIAINAGRGVGGSFVDDTPLEEELNLIQLNIASVVHLAKRVLPDMVARRSGRVLFTGSVVFGGTLKSKIQGNLNHLLPEETKANLLRDHSKPARTRRG